MNNLLLYYIGHLILFIYLLLLMLLSLPPSVAFILFYLPIIPNVIQLASVRGISCPLNFNHICLHIFLLFICLSVYIISYHMMSASLINVSSSDGNKLFLFLFLTLGTPHMAVLLLMVELKHHVPLFCCSTPRLKTL